MAVETGGQEGAGPSTFHRCKKFNGENALECCKWGVNFLVFSEKNFRLASLAFLIIKQQCEINKGFTQPVYSSKP